MKVFILLPDGVSLRNFAYTSFYTLGKEKGIDVVFWNATPFDLDKLGVSNLKIENPKVNWFTDILKSACKKIELKLFTIREKDSIYLEYNFPVKINSLKKFLKSILIEFFSKIYASENGLLKIRKKIIRRERNTKYYKSCINILKKENPNIIFCTSQRAGIAIAPLTAASDLNIPTASFVYSWDNIPKATTIVTTDFYFVWSDLMKKQLLKYQTYIKTNQVIVTGSPQFENHFNKDYKMSREAFCELHGLDISKKYICFSGDDFTTSPTDEFYLRDLAEAIMLLNNKGYNLGIIFRRCPVDFSNRYDKIIDKYQHIIRPIEPLWKKIGQDWDKIMPTKEDLQLQTNIIAHTECVVNLGSSMVFDYASYNKPCAFINYNYLNTLKTHKKGVYVYDYIHFRSMPTQSAVIWLSDPKTIDVQLEKLLKNSIKTVLEAKSWFEIINLHPPEKSSNRLWEQLHKLIT